MVFGGDSYSKFKPISPSNNLYSSFLDLVHNINVKLSILWLSTKKVSFENIPFKQFEEVRSKFSFNSALYLLDDLLMYETFEKKLLL